MDEIDRKILAAVQADARLSYGAIGEMVGLSVSAVNERLKKLQANGAIRGFHANLAPAAVGLDILAFIFVLLDLPAQEPAFLAAMQTDANVQECHHVAGRWSYLLKVRVADMAALEDFLSLRLKSLAGVARSETAIVLSSRKETASLPVG